MSRLLTTSFAIRATAAIALAAILVAGTLPHISGAAGNSKQLQHVRGSIGWSTGETATDFQAVFGKFDLPDDDYAVTRAQSAAVLAMPDSSLVSLGENTTVQVGAFDSAAAGPGSTIQLKNGALRFDVKRPQGGVANYRFVTTTSAVGVRGTVGLLSFVNGVTTVGCVACAADSVTVTVTATGQTVALATGQILTISAAGVVTTGALVTAVGAFTAAGVPVTAQATAVAAGLPAGGIAGVSAGTATAVGAAAVVTGTAIGIAASQPSPRPSATATSNGSTGTGTGQPGNVNLNGAARAPAAVASPQPAARPSSPPIVPGPGGRSGR